MAFLALLALAPCSPAVARAVAGRHDGHDLQRHRRSTAGGVGRRRPESAIDAYWTRSTGTSRPTTRERDLAGFNANATTDWSRFAGAARIAVISRRGERATGWRVRHHGGTARAGMGIWRRVAGDGRTAPAQRAQSSGCGRRWASTSSNSRRRALACAKPCRRCRLDVDGIAPGIAVDRIAERFDALGRSRLPRRAGRRGACARPQPGGPRLASGGRGAVARRARALCAGGTRRPRRLDLRRLSGFSRDRRAAASRTRSTRAPAAPVTHRLDVGHRGPRLGGDRGRICHRTDGAGAGGGHGARRGGWALPRCSSNAARTDAGLSRIETPEFERFRRPLR